tara:strand:+ start:2785 stop:3990 length:1206 start_codon:yes stop_codon:yes gene_type:complete
MNQTWSAGDGHYVTWKLVTDKNPKKIQGLFEVKLRGKFVPWTHFTFFTMPDKDHVIRQTKLLIDRLKLTHQLSPRDILLQLRQKKNGESILFRDPYFIKRATCQENVPISLENETSQHSPISSSLSHDNGTVSRFFVSDIVNPTNVSATSDDWSQFAYNPQQVPAIEEERQSVPLSISEQLNKVLNPVEPTRSQPLQEAAAADRDQMQTESENEPVIADIDPDTLRGYTTGVPPNKPGVYVLKLDNGKYYVGQTEGSVRDRIQEHRSRGFRCAYFVKKNTTSSSPMTYLRPKSYIPDDLGRWEEEETLHAMLTFKFDNVRGYVWSQPEHTLDDYKMLKKSLGGRLNCCYECGFKGHQVKKCPNVNTNNRTNWARHLDMLIRQESPTQTSLAHSAAAYPSLS